MPASTTIHASQRRRAERTVDPVQFLDTTSKWTDLTTSRVLRGELYLLLATIVLTAIAAAVFLTEPLSSKQAKPRPSLELRVADQNGRMRVDWDANRSDIQTAPGATLEVEDGGVLNRYPVEPNVLRSGGLDYVRQSDDVLLTLTLYHDGHPGVRVFSTPNCANSAATHNREAPPAQTTKEITRARRR